MADDAMFAVVPIALPSVDLPPLGPGFFNEPAKATPPSIIVDTIDYIPVRLLYAPVIVASVLAADFAIAPNLVAAVDAAEPN